MGERAPYRVPRSRAHETHRQLRAEIWEALEPLLFEPLTHASAARRVLERDFAAAVEQPHACAVHSGTIGLFLALRACGVEPGDEVITVGNSDISTSAAISHCGAVPVFCDVLATDYTIDPGRVEALITARTTAILPVDLHGHPADVRRLRGIAEQHALRIVEDAALATGARDHGRPVGAFADVTLFSFAPFKPLGCAGNGGMLVTADEQLARRIRLLCGYGHDPDPHGIAPGHQRYVSEGYNVPLDPLQAALVRVKLPHLDAWTERRRAIVARYAEGLRELDVVLPRFRPASRPTFRSYTVRVPASERQRVYRALLEAGIEVVLHYTPPAYRHPAYDDRLAVGELPVTEALARELLCLPVTVELEDAEVEYVVETLHELL
jgi:dTDP-3-amino-3,4,6-trideoxy-alpha-D-glucose transaminase